MPHVSGRRVLVKVVYKELYIGSYPIVVANPDYRGEDNRDDIEDEGNIDNFKLTCLCNIARYTFREGAATTVVLSSNCLAYLYNDINMFHEGAINVVLNSIHVAIGINSCQWVRERKQGKRQSYDSQVTN